MSQTQRYVYARKPESWVTIGEIISANPEAINNNFRSKNGILVSKVVFIGIAEGTHMGEKASTAVMVDGGRQVLHVTAFNENMPMVEMLSTNTYSIVVGRLKYDKHRTQFFVTPIYIENIPDAQRSQFLRFWYLRIVALRAWQGISFPKVPIARMLDDEQIPYEAIDGENDWIKIKTIDRPNPRRVITRGTSTTEEDNLTTMKTKVTSFLREKGQTSYSDYLEWAGENDINANLAEDIIMGLENDGVLEQLDDNQTLQLK